MADRRNTVRLSPGPADIDEDGLWTSKDRALEHALRSTTEEQEESAPSDFYPNLGRRREAGALVMFGSGVDA